MVRIGRKSHIWRSALVLLHASGPQQAHPILDRAFRHTPSLPLTTGPSLSNCIRRNDNCSLTPPSSLFSTYLAALIYYKALRHLHKSNIYPFFNDILNFLRGYFPHRKFGDQIFEPLHLWLNFLDCALLCFFLNCSLFTVCTLCTIYTVCTFCTFPFL